MTPGPHARFRNRLALLADDRTLAEVTGSSDRRFGRFTPGKEVWARLVVAAPSGDMCRLDVAEAPAPGFVPHADLGFIRLSQPTDDSALPGLAAVIAQMEDLTIVRYRPGSRCTLHGSTSRGERFVKVGSVGQAEHDRQTEIADVAAAGHIDVLVARPDRFDATTGALWQSVVAGRPLLPVLRGPSGPQVSRRMGELLGQIAGAPLTPPRRTGHRAALDRSRRAAKKLVARVPSLSGRVMAVLAGLEDGHDVLGDRDLVPTHGSAHAHQWLVGDHGFGLVDFDRYGMGELEQDIATLIVELESESGMTCPVPELLDHVVAGVEAAGVTVDPARLSLHRAHKRLAKATRTAWAIRPDGDVRAEGRLGAVEELLHDHVRLARSGRPFSIP